MERVLPSWVSNDRKYDRAVLELKKSGQAITDEAVKALYIKYGGLVLTEEVEVELEEKKENMGFRRAKKSK